MSYMIGWVEDLNFLNHLLVVLNSTDRLINKGLRPQIVREKYPNMISWYFTGRLYAQFIYLKAYRVLFDATSLRACDFFCRNIKCSPLFFCASSFLLCIPVIIFVHVACTSLHSH